MDTNGNSAVSTLVAAQHKVLADAVREEGIRIKEVFLLLRSRNNESFLAQHRLRRIATRTNVEQVAAAMRAHMMARSTFEALCDTHLSQFHGFAVNKTEIEQQIVGTESQFDEAERLSSLVGVNGKDDLNLSFAASAKAGH